MAAQVAHSDIPATGAFESSEPWLNRLFANIDWGQRGNFISVPTDCPQRDERLGWLGDAQIFARTACYNRDVAAFFAKWLDDVADAQHPSGAFPDIAPSLHTDHAAAPAWGDAGRHHPLDALPDVRRPRDPAAALRRDDRLDGFPGARKPWLPADSASSGNSYNDWLSPGDDRTPPELLATAYWAYDAP